MNCSVRDSVLLSCTMERQLDRLCLQLLWDFVRAKETLIKSPFFPVLFSFTAYMAFCLPYIALDFLSTRLPNLRKYKIQPQSYPTLGMMVPCFIQSVYHHVVWIFPVTFLHWYWKPTNLPVIAPELPQVLLQVGVCLLLFDFEYFLWHLLHHRVPWLYKTIHKVHHNTVFQCMGTAVTGILCCHQSIPPRMPSFDRNDFLPCQHLVVSGGPFRI